MSDRDAANLGYISLMAEDRSILASKREDIIEGLVAVKGDELNHHVVSKNEQLTNQCDEKKTTKECTAILPSDRMTKTVTLSP